jgi:hypothetical protein
LDQKPFSTTTGRPQWCVQPVPKPEQTQSLGLDKHNLFFQQPDHLAQLVYAGSVSLGLLEPHATNSKKKQLWPKVHIWNELIIHYGFKSFALTCLN